MRFFLFRCLFVIVLAGWLPAFAGTDGLAEIQKRGVLRIGVSEFAPWTFINRAGQLEGFEIENGNQIAADIGVKVEFKKYSMNDLLVAAERDEVDLIAAGLAITPARALRVEFSLPYFESGVSYVTNRQLAPGIKTPMELNKKGYVVAVVGDTFSFRLAQQLYDVAELKTFSDSVNAEKELIEGRVHGYITSLPEARMLARRNPEVIDLPMDKPMLGSVAGFAVKRGNQTLLNFLNAWIVAHTADHMLPTAYQQWFADFNWIQHIKK